MGTANEPRGSVGPLSGWGTGLAGGCLAGASPSSGQGGLLAGRYRGECDFCQERRWGQVSYWLLSVWGLHLEILRTYS